MSDLFKRLPTSEEKRRYSELWGGIPAWRCAAGMAGMFVLGLLLGLAL